MTHRILNSSKSSKFGKWHSVGFFSKKMISTETWYKTHNQELIAIVKTFKTWSHYFRGYKYKVLVLTNHNSLCQVIYKKFELTIGPRSQVGKIERRERSQRWEFLDSDRLHSLLMNTSLAGLNISSFELNTLSCFTKFSSVKPMFSLDYVSSKTTPKMSQ